VVPDLEGKERKKIYVCVYIYVRIEKCERGNQIICFLRYIRRKGIY
jgi:hypothetical protein